MRASKSAILAIATMACLALAAFAQSGGNRPRNYDPSTEVKVNGTVQKVIETSGRRGSPGKHLTLKTSNRTYEVHVGPSAFVSRNGFSFAAGDEIEVTGSKLNQGDTIIAREIKKDGKVLTLRDSQGIPKWSRGQRWQ
jgi:hypothetical protein